MKIEIWHRCDDFASYRAARVKSLFNCETGANFSLDAELPIERDDWRIGAVVGPSGSGKSSIGTAIWGETAVYRTTGWPADAPIIEQPLAGTDPAAVRDAARNRQRLAIAVRSRGQSFEGLGRTRGRRARRPGPDLAAGLRHRFPRHRVSRHRARPIRAAPAWACGSRPAGARVGSGARGPGDR